MKLSRELVTLILENNADWSTTPQGLLDIIIMIDHLSNKSPALANWNIPEVTETAVELGDSFLKAIPLKIAPYNSFYELSKTYIPGDHLRRKMAAMIKMIDEDQQLHKLAEETGIIPSGETLLVEKAMRILVNNVIDKWSVYVDFSD
ncbi:hypothetical protein [Chitinophaga sp. OAE865]|uniref:hypothetical protein n=1 Tax=Chitinophaga sp. OAE865 TaxID=2817898 RepID=UPI001AE5528E